MWGKVFRVQSGIVRELAANDTLTWYHPCRPSCHCVHCSPLTTPGMIGSMAIEMDETGETAIPVYDTPLGRMEPFMYDANAAYWTFSKKHADRIQRRQKVIQ
jgi:hypothetical protein